MSKFCSFLFLLFTSFLPAQTNENITKYFPDMSFECSSLLLKTNAGDVAQSRMRAPSPAPPPPPPRRSVEDNIKNEADLYNRLAEHLRDVDYSETLTSPAGTFYLNENMLWGLRGTDSETLLTPQFTVVVPFENSETFAAKKSGEFRFKFYDKKGEVISEAEFDYVRVKDDYVWVWQDLRMGAADVQGNILVQPEFDKLHERMGSYWVVEKDGKEGVISTNGDVVIPIKQPSINPVINAQNSPIFLTDNGNGKVRVIFLGRYAKDFDIKYTQFTSGRLSEENVMVCNGKIFNLDTGKLLFCGEHPYILAHPDIAGAYYIPGYIFNAEGELLTEPGNEPVQGYRDAKFDEHETLIVRRKIDLNGKSAFRAGMKDKGLNWLIKPDRYESLQRVPKTDFIVAKREDGQSGLINEREEVVMPFEYQRIIVLKDELAMACTTNDSLLEVYDFALVEKFRTQLSGTVIRAKKLKENFYDVYTKKGGYVINSMGDIIIEAMSSVTSIGNDLVKTKKYKDKVNRYFDSAGKNVLTYKNAPQAGEIKKVLQTEITNVYHFVMSDESSYLLNIPQEKYYKLPAEYETTNYSGDHERLGNYGLIKFYKNIEGRRQFGLLNSRGETVLTPEYAGMTLRDDYPGVVKLIDFNKKTDLITVYGNRRLSEYDSAEPVFANYYRIEKDGKFGITNESGNIIVPLEYRHIERVGLSGVFKVHPMTGGAFFVNVKGEKTEKL